MTKRLYVEHYELTTYTYDEAPRCYEDSDDAFADLAKDTAPHNLDTRTEAVLTNISVKSLTPFDIDEIGETLIKRLARELIPDEDFAKFVQGPDIALRMKALWLMRLHINEIKERSRIQLPNDADVIWRNALRHVGSLGDALDDFAHADPSVAGYIDFRKLRDYTHQLLQSAQARLKEYPSSLPERATVDLLQDFHSDLLEFPTAAPTQISEHMQLHWSTGDYMDGTLAHLLLCDYDTTDCSGSISYLIDGIYYSAACDKLIPVTTSHTGNRCAWFFPHTLSRHHHVGVLR